MSEPTWAKTAASGLTSQEILILQLFPYSESAVAFKRSREWCRQVLKATTQPRLIDNWTYLLRGCGDYKKSLHKLGPTQRPGTTKAGIRFAHWANLPLPVPKPLNQTERIFVHWVARSTKHMDDWRFLAQRYGVECPPSQKCAGQATYMRMYNYCAHHGLPFNQWAEKAQVQALNLEARAAATDTVIGDVEEAQRWLLAIKALPDLVTLGGDS